MQLHVERHTASLSGSAPPVGDPGTVFVTSARAFAFGASFRVGLPLWLGAFALVAFQFQLTNWFSLPSVVTSYFHHACP
jgi:hypothetical protein